MERVAIEVLHRFIAIFLLGIAFLVVRWTACPSNGERAPA